VVVSAWVLRPAGSVPKEVTCQAPPPWMLVALESQPVPPQEGTKAVHWFR